MQLWLKEAVSIHVLVTQRRMVNIIIILIRVVCITMPTARIIRQLLVMHSMGFLFTVRMAMPIQQELH